MAFDNYIITLKTETMFTIAAIITWITSAGKFLKETGGDSAVKEGAKSVFSWLKEKFTRPSQQTKIDDVQANPSSEDAIRQLSEMLKDAQNDDQDKINELNGKIAGFEKLVKDKMPAAHESITSIINSKNVIAGNAQISITGGGSFNQGDVYNK
ncbi:MAG: hypothetical protein ABI416_10950 [Ginsengibacter sp.]